MSMSSGDAEPVIFRPEYLLEVTNNDWKTFERFIEVFLKNCPEMIKRITEARRQGDLQELRRAAHTLRGSAGSFGAERLHAVAAELDTACREGQPDHVPKLVDRVLCEWGLLLEEIDRVLRER